MNVRRLLPPALILAMLAVGVAVAPLLPERVPIHWNLAGEADAWGGRWIGALAVPVVALAAWALVTGVTRLVERVRAVDAARPAIDRLQLYLVLVWVVLYASTLAPQLGYPALLDPTGAGLLAAGLFLLATGVVLRRTARGPGSAADVVRLPTDDPAVKRAVLRFGGWTLILAGAVMAPAALFGPGARLWALIASLGVPAVVLPAYALVRLLDARG